MAFQQQPGGSVVPAPAGAGYAAVATPLATHTPGAMLQPTVAEPTGPGVWLDVLGGVCLAIFVSFVMMNAAANLFAGGSWSLAIGWESVWLFAAMICATLMPLGMIHVHDVASTVKGLVLDWPEMAVATYVLFELVSAYGMPHGFIAPATMSFSVGAAEEFIFRVLLLGWLVTRINPQRALMVSAVVFGIAHLDTGRFLDMPLVTIMSITPQFAGGIVLGAMYLRTGNIIGPIIAHFWWDLPYFLTMGAGVSGGSAEGGMPSMAMNWTGFWSFWLWLAFALYGMWLIRPGQELYVRPNAYANHRPAIS